MDRNALTEQRRQTVIGLLKGMNIKKSSDGGFDKDDVYECMQQLCDLYEKNIEELENTYEGEIVSLKDKYQKYDDNNELYISLIMEAKKSSNDIINQAKAEVENILAEGKTAVAQQEQAIEQMRANMDAEREMLSNELNASREAVEAEKTAMKAELEAEKEKLSAMKSKYHQQINSMESEFMEIKTNILRTAGKIDSIKSKLSAEEEIAWDVIDDNAGVDFPSEDLQVEENIPYGEFRPESELSFGSEDVLSAEFAGIAAEEPAAPDDTEAVPEGFGIAGMTISDADAFTFDSPAEESEAAADGYAPVPEDPAFAAEGSMQAAENEAEYAAPEEVTLEDLMSDIEIDLPDFETPEQASDQTGAEMLNFDEAISASDTVDFAQPFAQTEASADTLQFEAQPVETPASEDDNEIEEISFEGLEELFKDEEQNR